jgi:hypothetical protein
MLLQMDPTGLNPTGLTLIRTFELAFYTTVALNPTYLDQTPLSYSLSLIRRLHAQATARIRSPPSRP